LQEAAGLKPMFPTRRIEPELLDHADPVEARLNLADLVRINQRFGGHSVIRSLMAAAAPQNQPFTLLDVGAASGDVARLIQVLYPLARVTSLDLHPVNLEAAPYPKLIADGFRLPFCENSFDFVLASLFLHHFPDEQVVELLRNFYRIARRALLISDLERHLLPYLFLPATRYFFGWRRITLHDGPISVRAAFRKDELLALSERAGLNQVQVAVHRPAFRISLIAKKAPIEF